MPKRLSTIPRSHLFLPEDLHLYEIQNIFTACALWLEEGMEYQIATYDLYVREMPPHRNFLVLGGIEEVITGIKQWRFSLKEIEYLRKHNLATPKLISYLRKFKFTGDLYAMREGTIFFPGEPVIRITGPICEGNLLSNFLMTTVFGNSLYLSKIIRGKIACGKKRFIAAGGMRVSSFETAMKASRAGYIAGADNAFPAFFRKYRLPPPPLSINAYHAVIKSFPTELEAFRAAARLFPNRLRPMVDTYDFRQGVANLVTVARELKKKVQHVASITIDSGDLHKRALYARRAFDRAGFPEIQILLASNLDEYKISALEKMKTPADVYLSATEISTVSDAPKMEIVYKIAELRDGRTVRPLAKLAEGKESYPGQKQVFRRYRKGVFSGDVIGLVGELHGKPLLQKMILRGKSVYNLPHLDTIKSYVQKQLVMLPERFKSIDRQFVYPVTISSKLKMLFHLVKKEHGAKK
ncbi:nicotinate phosphoribosyltransferase [Candidatus Uhrbacteria bacterium]|nr:nicotinate phosphoribosyltransferase [Candidatus Uhrbacteria bacterium]